MFTHISFSHFVSHEEWKQCPFTHTDYYNYNYHVLASGWSTKLKIKTAYLDIRRRRKERKRVARIEIGLGPCRKPQNSLHYQKLNSNLLSSPFFLLLQKNEWVFFRQFGQWTQNAKTTNEKTKKERRRERLREEYHENEITKQ